MSPSSEQVAVQSSGGAVRDAEPDGTVGLQVVLDRSLQAQYGELADSVHEQVSGCRRAEELQMKPLKLPKELFLDRIISMEDYQRSSRDQKKLIEQVVDW